jgi:YD repeat-containing protein
MIRKAAGLPRLLHCIGAHFFNPTNPTESWQTPASVTHFTYNTLGELTQILDPLSHATAIAYYPTGLIQSITDTQNNVTSYAFDTLSIAPA